MRRVAAGLVAALALTAAAVWAAQDDGGDAAEPAEARVLLRDSAVESARLSKVDLRGLVTRSAEQALARLPPGAPIEIEVKVGSERLIPQIGMGGRSDGRKVFVDVEKPLREDVETWLPALVAHELYHVARFRARRRYGGTLAEALVSEGLADHFAHEAFPETPPQPWNVALTRAQEREVWREARGLLNVRDGYDHVVWFFGGGSLPPWAGYTLGYRIVDAYLSENGRASAAVGADPAAVILAYRGP